MVILPERRVSWLSTGDRTSTVTPWSHAPGCINPMTPGDSELLRIGRSYVASLYCFLKMGYHNLPSLYMNWYRNWYFGSTPYPVTILVVTVTGWGVDPTGNWPVLNSWRFFVFFGVEITHIIVLTPQVLIPPGTHHDFTPFPSLFSVFSQQSLLKLLLVCASNLDPIGSTGLAYLPAVTVVDLYRRLGGKYAVPVSIDRMAISFGVKILVWHPNRSKKPGSHDTTTQGGPL